MKNNKILFFVALLFIYIIVGMLPVSAATNDGETPLDVVLVIDNSGSMLRSDEEKLAFAASNWVIDSLSDVDKLGFIVFSHKIDNIIPLEELLDINVRNSLKNSVNSIEKIDNMRTDISMGLSSALDILAKSNSIGNDTRKPVIILLGDGNTELEENGEVAFPEESRTNAESLKELEEVKQTCANKNIPIYTIGLNFNPEFKNREFQMISDSTGGEFYETKNAYGLQEYIITIIAKIKNSKVINGGGVGTGEPQKTTFNIPNNSVYEATFTALSDGEIKDAQLIANGEVQNDKDNVSIVYHNDYTLIKVKRPSKGGWDVIFTAEEGASWSLSLIMLYDLGLRIDVPSNVILGNEVDVEAVLIDFSENELSLADNFGNKFELTFSVLDGFDNEIETRALDAGEWKTQFSFKSPGKYTIYATLETESNTINAETIFNISTEKPSAIDEDISLFPFFTNTEKQIAFSDIFTIPKLNYPIRIISKELGIDETLNEEDVADFLFQIQNIHEGVVDILLRDNYDNECASIISVEVFPALWAYIILGGALAVILTIILLIARAIIKGRPYLDKTVKSLNLEISLPHEFIMDGTIPSDAIIIIPHTQKSVYLLEQLNSESKEEYEKIPAQFLNEIYKIKLIPQRKSALGVSLLYNSQFKLKIGESQSGGLSQLKENAPPLLCRSNVHLIVSDISEDFKLTIKSPQSFPNPFENIPNGVEKPDGFDF